MPARSRCPCVNARVVSYVARAGVLWPPRGGRHSVCTPASVTGLGPVTDDPTPFDLLPNRIIPNFA